MKKRIIHYEGFHTNSSSSHSLLIIHNPEAEKLEIQHSTIDEFYFSSEDFLLEDPKEKAAYILLQIADGVGEWLKEKIKEKPWIKTILDEVGFTKKELETLFNDGAVDGSSRNSIFSSLPEKIIRQLIFDSEIIVVGGGDNVFDIYSYFVDKTKKAAKQVIDVLPMAEFFKQDLYHAVDKLNTYKIERSYYTIVTRPKARIIDIYSDKINTIDDLHKLYYKDGKTDIPIFLDVRLYSECDFRCPFCYTKSKPKKYISWVDVSTMLKRLDSLGVTQVALGGGFDVYNSTFDSLFTSIFVPYLLDFVKGKRQMVINYTFRDWISLHYIYKLLTDVEKVTSWLKYVDKGEKLLRQLDELKLTLSELFSYMGVGFSVNTPQEVDNTILLFSSADEGFNNFVFHIIPELWSKPDLEYLFTLMKRTPLSFLFLGFKKPVRYQDYYKSVISQFDVEWFLTNLIEVYKYNKHISFDTVFIRKFYPVIQNTSLNSLISLKNMWMHEGLISKYLDLEAGKVYKSSFELEESVNVNTKDKQSLKKALTHFFV